QTPSFYHSCLAYQTFNFVSSVLIRFSFIFLDFWYHSLHLAVQTWTTRTPILSRLTTLLKIKR
ncbi:hypothetical protein KSS87_004972, partial [Heliosperma pusillum]